MQGCMSRLFLGRATVATNRLEGASHMPKALKRLLDLYATDRRIPCLAFRLNGCSFNDLLVAHS